MTPAQTELDQAGVICIADLAHPTLVDDVFRQLEVCVIEEIEELCSELHSPALRQAEILQNGEILVNEVWANQRPTAF